MLALTVSVLTVFACISILIHMKTAAALRFHIDPSSGSPIYRQVVDQVRAQVAGGRLVAGDFLPSVRQVAKAFAVNPMTVSRAYSLLEEQGLVERVRGKGMRVCAAGSASDESARLEQLRPLLEQTAQRAHELNLTAEQVLDLLRSLLEEFSDA